MESTQTKALSSPVYMADDFVSLNQFKQQQGITDSKTVYRMIAGGELPGFSYGNRYSKKKGWHRAVLEAHSLRRYENVGCTS